MVPMKSPEKETDIYISSPLSNLKVYEMLSPEVCGDSTPKKANTDRIKKGTLRHLI